jgi:hypothetical protein
VHDSVSTNLDSGAWCYVVGAWEYVGINRFGYSVILMNVRSEDDEKLCDAGVI